MVTKGEIGGERINQEFGINIYAPTTYKIEDQPGPTVQHREFSTFQNDLYGKRMGTCTRVTESLSCAPETNTMLQINDSPI